MCANGKMIVGKLEFFERKVMKMVKAAFEEAERTAGEGPRLGSSVSFDEQLAKKFPKDVITRVRRRAEEATERDTYQAMEGFVHNMNTLNSRAGAQVNGCLAWR